MRIVVSRDRQEFAERVQAFLAGGVEPNVLATVLASVLHGSYDHAAPVFGYGTNDRGEVSFAALRTPPLPLLVSELDARAAGELMDRWLSVDPDLPGVSACQ